MHCLCICKSILIKVRNAWVYEILNLPCNHSYITERGEQNSTNITQLKIFLKEGFSNKDKSGRYLFFF